jgi:hypothetical protein
MPKANTKKVVNSAVIRFPRDTLTVKSKYVFRIQIINHFPKVDRAEFLKIHSNLSGAYKISQKFADPKIPLSPNVLLVLWAKNFKDADIK